MLDEKQVKELVLDPSNNYSSPSEVLKDRSLTDKQRMEVLLSWEQDAREMDVAQEEGMSGGESGILDEVLAALKKLDGSQPVMDAPNKQGGHSA